MTLRVRLTAYYTFFFALALLLLGSGLYFLMRQLLLNSVANELRVGATVVEQAADDNSAILHMPNGLDLVGLRSPDIHDVEAPELYAKLQDASGELLSSTPNLAAGALPVPPEQRAAALADRETVSFLNVGSARVLSLITPLTIDGEIVGLIQVAQSLREIDRALRVLLWALAGGGLITLLVAVRGSLWLARAALQPIDQVSTTAAQILHAADLHQRVPEAPAADEVGRLTRTMNEMLARMERVFDAQQRFTADVAHELRTPLAAMRGNLEILQRGAARDPAMLQESLGDMEREVLRLTRMANGLLLLAQADAGVPLHQDQVQLDELLVEVYRDLRPLAAGVALRLNLEDQVALQGDRDRIKQALVNLVANALQHTPAGGEVTLSLQRAGDTAVVAVQDTGTGIAPEQVALLFDRFYRGDQSRSRGGAGLGLAIVKWVAEAHGGAVSVASAPGQGATFRLQLPITPPAPAAAPAPPPVPLRATGAAGNLG